MSVSPSAVILLLANLCLASGTAAAGTGIGVLVKPVAVGNHSVAVTAGGRRLLTACTGDVDAMGGPYSGSITIPAQGYYTVTTTGNNKFSVRACRHIVFLLLDEKEMTRPFFAEQVGAYATDGSSALLVSTTDTTIASGLDFSALSVTEDDTCYYSGSAVQVENSCTSYLTTVKITCDNLFSSCPVKYSVLASYVCLPTTSSLTSASNAIKPAAALVAAAVVAVYL